MDRERYLFDRALGGDEPPLGLDFEAIEHAGARATRRRRIMIPAVTAVAAAVLLGGAMMVTNSNDPVEVAGPSVVPTETSTAVPGMPSGVPDTPVVGMAYPYELNTHCGIRSAHFGGRWWTAIAPTEQPHPGGRDTTAGTMTLVRADLARFTWPDGSADFAPLPSEPMPPCQ